MYHAAYMSTVYQSMIAADGRDFVNVLCTPRCLDLSIAGSDDDVMVRAVSCGSRHTAIVTGERYCLVRVSRLLFYENMIMVG